MTFVDRARKSVDQAEVYAVRRRTAQVRFSEGALALVAHRDTSACALRVIAKGRLGASFGQSSAQAGLLEDAIAAAAYGQEASFSFAPAQEYPPVQGSDPVSGSPSASDLIDLAVDVRERIARVAPDAVVNLLCEAECGERSIETTEGAATEETFARTTLGVEVPFPSRATDVGATARLIFAGPVDVPDAWIDDLLERWRWGTSASVPTSGRLPVLLTPYTSHLLTLTLAACLGSDSVSRGASPLGDKVGEQILSDRLTIREDPTYAGLSFARSFDDEGVAVQPRAIIERGVLRSFLTDLRGAADLGQSSAGNAARRTMFSEKIEDAPVPSWLGAIIEPGEDPWRDLMGGIDEGLLVTRLSGLHSSNLLQGQYAVKADGFHIRNGEPVGYLERTMIAGNVFEDFRNVRAVSSERKLTAQAEMEVAGLAPYILLDSAQVTVG